MAERYGAPAGYRVIRVEGAPSYDHEGLPFRDAHGNSMNARAEEWLGNSTSLEVANYDDHFEVAVDVEVVASREESQALSAEQKPQAELLQDLYDIWQLPAEMEADHQQWFETTSKDFLAQSLSPTERQRLTCVTEVIGWRMFSKPGDPLPKGLMIRTHPDDESKLVVRRDWRVIGREDEAEVRQAMEPFGLEGIMDERHAYRKQRCLTDSDDIKDKLVLASPQYAFLKAFASEEPKMNERPLNTFEKLVQAAQLEEKTRQQFAMAPKQSLRTEADAKSSIDRGVFRLDEEVILQRTDSDTDPLTRARNYFTQVIKEGLAADHDAELVEMDNIHGVLAIVDGRRTRFLHSQLRPILDRFNKSIHPTSGFELDPASQLFSKFVEHVFSRSATTRSYEKLLHGVAFDTVLTSNELNVWDQPYNNDKVNAWLVPPQGPICTDPYTVLQDLWLRPLQLWRWDDEEVEKPGVVSADMYRERDKETVGRVWRGAAVKNDLHTRLILSEIPERDQELPTAVADPDLQLSLQWYGGGSGPIVPGYNSVAADWDDRSDWLIVQYKKVETDPYEAVDVMLPTAGQRTLTHEYHKLGLEDLAVAVEAGTVTVSELAGLIAAHSDYTFDPSYDTWYNDELAVWDYDDKVEGGRLQLQCSGAALFLEASLVLAFGTEVKTRTISGQAMQPGSKRISSLGHAQVLFTHEGATHILDATPAMRVPPRRTRTPRQANANSAAPATRRRSVSELAQGNLNSIKSALAERRQSRLVKPEKVKQPKVKEDKQLDQVVAPKETEEGTTVSEAKALPEISTESQESFQVRLRPDILKLQAELHQQLQVALDARDDEELYEKATTLKDSDPVRKVMSVASLAVRGELEPSELPVIKAYVGSYAAADKQVLDANGMKVYPSETLRYLQSFVQRLLATQEV